MSKQRPSSWRRITPGGAVRSSSRRNSVALWRRRVFQNSYTRNGRTRRVSRWSVKIQHRGRRHTLSLTAASRVAAAREARSLNDIIRREGWDAARQILGRGSPASSPPAPATSRGGGWSKSDARYLRERLIHSKYTEARLTKTKEFSVRLEHEGIDHYFPLGTDDREHATAQAIKIYHTIVTQGWNAAFHQFPREITVAIFWSTSPVACTYATLFTFAGEFEPNPLPAPATAGPRKRVFVIESDTEVRRTLAFWLGRQPGFDCTRVFQNAEEARVIIVRDPPDLLLVNRALPGMPVAEFLEQLKIRLPNVPAFMYGIYQDSDHIFISLSGVTAGYIFRRRKPHDLFDPIRGAVRQRGFSAKEIFLLIRDYFQSLFGFAPPGDETPGLASLTAREQEILNHVSKGFLDKEIANALSISVWTVHNHLKHVYEKLNVHTRTEAVLKYLQK